ncbi:Short chain dehydrogenase yanD [Talaromyces pinophilus]|nr:Short chain dehydrogenase yanD [Talaromyces pinophilus]
MHSQQKKGQSKTSESILVASKDMPPLPENFGPVFFKNQFRTKISLPTKEKYPSIAEKSSCAIITGANVGLGLEAAKQLLSLGLSHLVMAVRSIEKGNTAAKQLRAAAGAHGNPSAKIDVWQLDMESYESIQAFVQKCQETLTRIDFVILNAGLGAMTFSVVPSTSHEKTMQVNHISTGLLAILLLPVLKSKSMDRNRPARLTVVNSVTAHLCKIPNKDKRPFLSSFDNTAITPWDAEERYGVSKLLSQLFIVRLAEHVDPDQVIINMVDPGLTKGTRLSRDAKGPTGVAAKMFFSIAGRPVERGAATYVDAVAGHSKESHGCFLMNCQIAPLSRWFYTDGNVLNDLIWAETLRELGFANAEQIISSMHRDV